MQRCRTAYFHLGIRSRRGRRSNWRSVSYSVLLWMRCLGLYRNEWFIHLHSQDCHCALAIERIRISIQTPDEIKNETHRRPWNKSPRFWAAEHGQLCAAVVMTKGELRMSPNQESKWGNLFLAKSDRSHHFCCKDSASFIKARVVETCYRFL